MADERTILVTGANRGIGYGIAQTLAGMGHRVVLAGRDLARLEDAEEEIRRTTGNRELYVAELDLASLAAVRRAADDVLERFDPLHVLVNNAGVFTHERRQSADGFELQFAVNHLGHFLLTVLLRERLVASAPARIVHLASRAHFRGRLDLERVEQGGREPYDGYQAYADSKLANVLFSRELARRLSGTGVTSNAVHPGIVDTDMLTDYLKAPPVDLGKDYRSLTEGADTAVWAATAPALESESGEYFADRQPEDTSAAARDETLAQALWAWSDEAAGLV